MSDLRGRRRCIQQLEEEEDWDCDAMAMIIGLWCAGADPKRQQQLQQRQQQPLQYLQLQQQLLMLQPEASIELYGALQHLSFKI
ncbi:GL26122 [Drosophila persimilis]|uniref:GL26122 n=1 Tax=Drosophila persimilis TaxID=7234 RepID=B4GKN4_DROPE|nr:GL26122 [Drosophila persimilis]